jgi:tetratricopeptide (TPR) repeat protein
MPLRVLWVGCLVGICWLGLGAGGALADDAASARELFKKGQAHYAVGEYEAAADAYLSAYKLKPDSALLFNAAQACRLGGKLDRALTLYRNYLRFYPEAKNADSVRAQIAKLEKQIETERAAATAPPPAASTPPPLSPSPVTTPPAPTAETPALSATAPPPQPIERPIYKKMWFWGAVGGAVVAAAVVVAVVAAGSGDGGAWNNLPEVRELRGAAVTRW